MNTTDRTKGTAFNRLADRCVDCGQKLMNQLNAVRNSILNEVRETLHVNDRLARLAINEAEALAWQTDYPHLFFPTLAQEKIQAVAAWNTRQRRVRREPQTWFAE